MINRNNLKNYIKETDFILLGLCLAATLFGILMVFSATMCKRVEGQAMARDCVIMILSAGLGIIAGIVISFFDYEIISRLWPVVAAVCLGLMGALFIWGTSAPGRPDAICWLELGPINVQPSEIMKVGFIITFAYHLDSVRHELNSIKNIALLSVHAALPTALVVATDDLGSALIFIAIFIGMMFVAGVDIKYFILGIAAVLVALPVLWVKFFSQFQKNRLLAIYHPASLDAKTYNDIVYQQQRGLNAIGAGGFFGSGLFKGAWTQSNSVPVNESDMIFSVVGEELGFIGCIVLLVLLSVIIFRVAATAKKSNNLSGALLCYGVAFMIGAQSIINIGMCMKLLPCIGITLPFISAGGSANISVYLAIGLVLSVYRFNCNRNPGNFRYSGISTPFSES